MFAAAPEFSINFRQEILTRFFNHVQSAESFYVVGAASMGKTRLLDHLSRQDVQKYYLGEKSDQTWLVRVDMNRLFTRNEAWAFYELMLSSIVMEANRHENNAFKTQLLDLNAQVIQNRDPLFALRFFEMAVSRLCHEFGLKLCFMLDEFDETYKDLTHETFAQLRAVRDANKSRVLFAIFLRTLPERLRSNRENESFYELFSRNMIGLTPYTKPDTLQSLQLLEFRRNFPLTPAQRDLLCDACGGHIGLLQAMLGILIDEPQTLQRLGAPGWLDWYAKQPVCIEECRKILDGLDSDEINSLSAVARGDQTRISMPAIKLLLKKGLLQTDANNGPAFFSPIFGKYLGTLTE